MLLNRWLFPPLKPNEDPYKCFLWLATCLEESGAASDCIIYWSIILFGALTPNIAERGLL